MEILMFTSPTCGPCKQLKPLILAMQERHKFKLRIVEASPETRPEFQRYGVRSVPAVYCIDEDGNVKGHFAGAFATVLEAELKHWGAIPL